MLLSPHAAGGAVETLRYKPKGRGFDSRWCYGICRSRNPSRLARNGNGYREDSLGRGGETDTYGRQHY